MSEEFRGSDRYAVIRRIGAGGMGVVYEAQDLERGTRVALKTLRQLEPTALYRFKHEFRSLADVCHPNLVYLYELVSASSGWFFVMELIDGVDFLEWVRIDGQPADDADTDATTCRLPVHSSDRVPPPRAPMPSQPTQSTAALGASQLMAAANRIVRPPRLGPVPHYDRLREALLQLVDGVNALHAAGKLHRDIKPSNILVTPDGRVALLDFGLTTGFDPREGDTTFAGKLVGTAGYVSPEQCAGKQPTTQSDWYGVGVVLYHALVGRLPFSGPPARVLAEKRRMDPPSPRQLRPNTPADLDALCMALLRRAPEKRPTGAEILRMLGRGRSESVPTSPWAPRLEPGALMGRNTHLMTLKRAFEAVCAGQAATVYVRGSSGIGKTALIQYFLDGLVENRGALLLRGRAHERESVPYKAFDSLIDALSRQLLKLPPDDCLHVVPEDAWALARIFPVLARVPAIRQIPEPVEAIPAPALRRRAFLALRALLDRLAGIRKLVLFLDDLQWGDLDSASLLLEIMRPPLPPPLLLIGSYRTEDADTSPMVRALAAHRRARGADVLELVVGPLRHADSFEVALQLLGRDDSGARDQAASIAFEAKGSPFLISELARWTLESSRGTTAPAGDVSLEAVLQQRLSTVFEGARHVLELVAVSGQPVALGALADAAGLGDRQRDALASLRAARLLRTGPRAGTEVAEPYDDRIREVVLAGMDPARVREAHRVLALAHEREGAPDPEALSEHHAAAGDYARCAHWAAIAADRASQAFAFAHAARLYQRALDHLPAAPQDTLRLRLGLAEALANAGRPADAARAFQDAASCASDGAHAIALNHRAAEQWLRAGQIDDGVAALGSVLRAWRMPIAPSATVAHRSARLRRLHVILRGLRFRQRPEALVADETLAAVDLAWSAATGLSLIDPVCAVDYVSRSLLLSLRAGEPFRVARSLCGEALVATMPGRRGEERARKVLDLARDIAQRTDSLHAMGLAAAGAGLSSFLQGQWKSAREWCDRAEPILGELRTGTDWELAVARLAGLHACFMLGDFEPLLHRVPELVADADARGDGLAAVALRIGYLNLAWLLRGEEDTAVRHLREARSRWSHSGLDVVQLAGLLSEVNVHLYVGDSERALQTLEKRWTELRRSPALSVQMLLVEALWLRGRCLIAAAADRRTERSLLPEVEQIARELESQKAAWAQALSLMLRGCAARLSRDDARAVALFGQAEDACVQCDMAFHATVARRRLGRLIGGASGAGLLAQSESWMTSHGISEPDRITKVFAPGTFHIRLA